MPQHHSSHPSSYASHSLHLPSAHHPTNSATPYGSTNTNGTPTNGGTLYGYDGLDNPSAVSASYHPSMHQSSSAVSPSHYQHMSMSTVAPSYIPVSTIPSELSPSELESFRYTYRPSKKSQADVLLPPLVDNLLLPPNSSINQSAHFRQGFGITVTDPPPPSSTTNYPPGSIDHLSSSSASGASTHPSHSAVSVSSAPTVEAAPGFLAPPIFATQIARMGATNADAAQEFDEDTQNILKRRKRKRHPEK